MSWVLHDAPTKLRNNTAARFFKSHSTDPAVPGTNIALKNIHYNNNAREKSSRATLPY
jgi:hypothetical protein